MSESSPTVATKGAQKKSTHTAFTATLLLMASTVASGALGLVRTKYINHIFGAGAATDAYNNAFNLPDMLGYFLVGVVASISLITILNRSRENGEDENEALSAVLNAMVLVLGAAIVLAEIFAPLYTRVMFPKMSAESAAMCTRLTRIMLPQPLLLFIGGVLGARLLVRKIFVYQAVTPLIYNLGIIFGAAVLSRWFGIYGLGLGVVVGALAGPALMTAFGAARSGMRYRPIFKLNHPAFREWLRLSFPLMIGLSLTYADKWILSYYSSGVEGAISRLSVAKLLFNVPMSMLGGAAGAASLPFFSALFTQGKHEEFAAAVNRAISRVMAASLLIGAWLIALSFPVVDLFRGGSFTATDTAETAQYLRIFAVAIAVWAVQALYSRSFYAAGNTLTPAITGWVVTAISIPVYALLFSAKGVPGLAMASGVGMLLSVIALAVLLDRMKLVPLRGLEFGELARALLAAVLSGVAAWWVLGRMHMARGHSADLIAIAAGTAVWAAVCLGVLLGTGSKLPKQLLRRRAG